MQNFYLFLVCKLLNNLSSIKFFAIKKKSCTKAICIKNSQVKQIYNSLKSISYQHQNIHGAVFVVLNLIKI